MINILVVDDHTIFREGLKRIIDQETDMRVTAEAASAKEALESLQKDMPDLVVLDISMPGKDGIELLKDIRLHYEKLKVLMLSTHPEDRYAIRSIKAGAMGYISKEKSFSELATAIRKVITGNKYISTDLSEKILNSLGANLESKPHDVLSEREFEILRKIASGKSVKDIAAELSLSPNTISSYRERVLLKLEIKSTAELITYAHRNNLID